MPRLIRGGARRPVTLQGTSISKKRKRGENGGTTSTTRTRLEEARFMLDESDGDESDPDPSIDTDIAGNVGGHFILKGDWQKFLGDVPDGGRWHGDIGTHDMPEHGLIMTKGKKWCILGRKMKRDCRRCAQRYGAKDDGGTVHQCREVAGSSARCGWCTLAGRPCEPLPDYAEAEYQALLAVIPEDLPPGALVDNNTTKALRKHALAVGRALNLAEKAREKQVKQKIASAKRLKAEVDKDENAVLGQMVHSLDRIEEAVTSMELMVASIFEIVKSKLVDPPVYEDTDSSGDL